MKNIGFLSLIILSVVLNIGDSLAQSRATAPAAYQQPLSDAQAACAGKSDVAQCIIDFNMRTSFQSQCNEAQNELRKAKSAFSSECAKVGGGNCFQAGINCDKCNGLDGDDVGCDGGAAATRLQNRQKKREEEERSLTQRLKAIGRGQGEYDDYEEREYNNITSYRMGVCPPFAKQTAKDMKEEMESIRDKKNDMRDSVSDAETKLMTAKNALADAQADCTKKDQDLDREFKEKSKSMNRESEENNKKILSEMSQIDAEIDLMHAKMRRREVDYFTQVANIEKICEDDAERKLNDLQAKRAADRAGNRLKAKSINALLTTLGTGRVAEDERTRQKLVAQCQQNGTKLQKPLTLLNNSYKADLQDMKEAIERLIKLRESKSQEKTTNSNQFTQDYAELQENYLKAKEQLNTQCSVKIGQCQAPQQVNNISSFFKAVKKGTIGQQPQATLANCSGLTGEVVAAQQNLSFKQEDLDYLDKKHRSAQETYSDALDIVGGLPPKNFDENSFYKAYADLANAVESYNDKAEICKFTPLEPNGLPSTKPSGTPETRPSGTPASSSGAVQ